MAIKENFLKIKCLDQQKIKNLKSNIKMASTQLKYKVPIAAREKSNLFESEATTLYQ